jgi:DNA mismatch repair ATPase MutS
MNPSDFYQNQVKVHTNRYKQKNKQSQTFTFVRLAIFIATVFLLYYFWDQGLVTIVSIAVVGFIIFLIAVVRHRTIDSQRDLEKVLVKLNENEIKRYYGELPEEGFGRRYLNGDNLFAKDFDIFGKRSLFQHVDRCVLRKSKDRLADFLIELKDIDEVQDRQLILKELKERIEWVQLYQARLTLMASRTKEEVDLDDFQNIKKNSTTKYLAFVLLAVSLTLIGLYFAAIVPFALLLVIAVVNYSIMMRYQASIFHLGIKTDVLIKHIQTHLEAMRLISQVDFTSEPLKRVTESISKKTLSEIESLERTIRWLDSRGNMLYGILNAFLVLDLFTYYTLTSWLERNSEQFNEWIDVVYEMEMYASLAAYVHQNPSFVFPELTREDYTLESEQMGHPLIRPEERVCNDFNFNAERLYLVTGSNMSGKSTFLRTVGLNTVMAWIGLPVCARHFKTSRYLVFSSMRTQDDLAENTSSFYAELRRIKLLFSLLENSEVPVLYFLDEILKGTNSGDRHSGSIGIIQKLLQRTAIGFISTHDLELADDYQDNDMVKNISFNSTLRNGELHFDYKLSDGKCYSTNASQLMKSMGIID